jgi:hypothetical protein
MHVEKTIAIIPQEGADEECDSADADVVEAEKALNAVLRDVQRSLRSALKPSSFAGLVKLIELENLRLAFGIVHKEGKRSIRSKYRQIRMFPRRGLSSLVLR